MNTRIFKRIQFAVFYLLPCSVAQCPSSQPLPPAESKAQLQRLDDSLRKYGVILNQQYVYRPFHKWLVLLCALWKSSS